MEGTINNYKRSIKRTSQTHMIVIPAGTKNKEEADKLVGKKVSYNTGKKEMHGKVASSHGARGAVRVIFETGMPGQSIGKKVKIE
jgi:large subunit ribosomal protein L35Ae